MNIIRKFITFLFASAAIIVAYKSIDYFLGDRWNDMAGFKEDPYASKILFIWIFGPPIWFFFERYVVWYGTTDAERMGMKEGRELAKPLWAAVLATLVLLIK